MRWYRVEGGAQMKEGSCEYGEELMRGRAERGSVQLWALLLA